MKASFALFDFDGTLRRGDSIVSLMCWAYRQKHCALGPFLRGVSAGLLYCLHRMSAKKSKEAALSFLKGKSRQELESLGTAFAREVLLPSLYAEGREEIRRCLAEGKKLWIITASPDFYMEPLGNMLGAHRVIATRLAYRDDAFTGEIVEDCRREEKLRLTRRALTEMALEVDAETSTAYGDSWGDQYVMALCGQRIYVNPGRRVRRLLSEDSSAKAVFWHTHSEDQT